VVVFDHVVIADGDHALAHLVPRGFTVEAPLFPPLLAKHAAASAVDVVATPMVGLAMLMCLTPGG
jgi:hypothetical protein